MTKRSATTLLITAMFALCAVSAHGQGRIALTWEVTKYDISASIPSDTSSSRSLDVTAVLSLKNVSRSASPRLTLRISEEAEVSSVTANGTAADFSKAQESIGGGRSIQKIVSRIPSVASGQILTVSVKYKLNVKENSGLASLSAIGNQFLPMSFWYPTPTSWFYPGGADFAPMKINVSAPAGTRVFAAGNASGNSYEVQLNGQPFFVAGQYESSTVDGVEIGYIKRTSGGAPQARLEELASIATRASAFVGGKLGRKLGTPIRILCVKRGAGFSDSGMILVDDSVLVRDKFDAQAAATVIEGIAKSYLGNVIKVEDDGYGVIREGLSRYLANEFIEQEYGEEVAAVGRLEQRTSYATIARRDAPLNVVSPVDGYYYVATANKGAFVWGHLADTFGDNFYEVLRSRSEDGVLDLAEIRQSFSSEKAYLDYTIDQVTQLNLMVGLPQQVNGGTKAALRNIGDIDARVVVAATTSSGKILRKTVTIPAKSFGEAVFDSQEKVVRVVVDENKSYPQTDYSDDVAPRVIDETDPILYIKKEFDRQRYSEAERNAGQVLDQYPEFHDARILLARALLAGGKFTEAQRQYDRVIASKLPSPQSLAWAELGLGDVASKTGQASVAAGHYMKAIAADAEYGTTLGAVRNLISQGGAPSPDDSIKAFFSAFDRAAVSNSKVEVQSILEGGEVSRFAANVAGQAQEWTTTPVFIQEIDGVDVLVAANISLRLINKEVETGIAMFRLSRTPAGLRLSGLEIFEVG